jgi:hypothetical protein
MWYLSKLHIKYKRPWYTIGSSSSFLILISGLFYLYPEKPDIEGFINQQQTQLIVTSPTTQPPRQAYIKVVNLETQTEKELFFQTGTQFFSVPNQYQLSYISNNSHNTAEIFLLFPDGNLLQLFPQSAIRFQEEIISEAGSFLEYNTIWTENNNNDTYLSITHFYRKNFQTHLTQQI